MLEIPKNSCVQKEINIYWASAGGRGKIPSAKGANDANGGAITKQKGRTQSVERNIHIRFEESQRHGNLAAFEESVPPDEEPPRKLNLK